MVNSSSETTEPIPTCHVVAMPFPGRGHVNPMMNFCKLIAAAEPLTTTVTFIVTEEWHGFISSDPKPPNLRLATIPNVIPSEKGRAENWAGFIRATLTNLEAPVERLLDRLPKPNVIIHDTFMKWMVGIGNRRNIPVASFWTQSATTFSILHHFEHVLRKGHFKANLSEKGNELVDYLPGVAPIRFADLLTGIYGKGQEMVPDCVEAISLVSKSQFLLFTSTYELESQTIDALAKDFPFPVHSIGPAIPQLDLSEPVIMPEVQPGYLKWLDSQPEKSVMYISQGSFLSVSKAQLDEIVAGVLDSGVRFLWVTREGSSIFQENGGNMNGMVVDWCDQLKVLCRPSVGGFWSHCGWNSTKEAVFSGIPVLTFPIFWDQPTNGKQIVEDWKMGWRVKKENDGDELIPRAKIADLVRKFMDLESHEGEEIRRRAKELQRTCRGALEEGGSAKIAIDAFLKGIKGGK